MNAHSHPSTPSNTGKPKKNLLAELEQSFLSRGYKKGEIEIRKQTIEKDGKKVEKYEVVEVSPRSPEFKKENLRLIKEVPNTIELPENDPYVKLLDYRIQKSIEDEKKEGQTEVSLVILEDELVERLGSILVGLLVVSSISNGTRSAVWSHL